MKKSILLITLFSILLLITIFYLYKKYEGNFITAKFSDSRPLHTNMPVYYKGYEIGKTKKIELTEDYKYTLVKILLYPSNPKLPENITARAKGLYTDKDYIELINQDQPSTAFIKKGGPIEGKAAFDIESFLSDIADAEIIVPLLQNFSDTLSSFDKTSVEIKNFFSDSRSVLKDNKENLKQATTSLNKITSKFDNSIPEDKIKNTVSNVDKSAANILDTSENIKKMSTKVNCAIQNLDTTMANIDSTICETKTAVSNIKVITQGFCEVLTQRFAGLKIIFGKPLKNNACPKNCSK